MPEIRASIARTRDFLYFPPIQKPRKYPTIIAIAAPSRKNARACYAAPPASENARYADIERQQASRLPATAAVYFCYAPWNYLFLGASVEAARAQIAGTGRCREPLKQNKQFRHVKSGSDGSHGLLYCEDIVLTQQKVI